MERELQQITTKNNKRNSSGAEVIPDVNLIIDIYNKVKTTLEQNTGKVRNTSSLFSSLISEEIKVKNKKE